MGDNSQDKIKILFFDLDHFPLSFGDIDQGSQASLSRTCNIYYGEQRHYELPTTSSAQKCPHQQQSFELPERSYPI
jgi:hypothetical protein